MTFTQGPQSGITETEYEEYLRDTPLEARFDVEALQILVIDAIPKHKAYDMTFSEYMKERSRFSEYDVSEKKRLTFTMPLFPSLRTGDFAFHYKISVHRTLITMIELGLITMMYDHHDSISTIKTVRKNMSSKISASFDRGHFDYISVGEVKMRIHHPAKACGGTMKRFSPSVQEWVYNAIGDLSYTLGMTVSDLCNLCWCICVNKNMDLGVSDPITDSNCDEIISTFTTELGWTVDKMISI